jgi:hypothetical protein
MFSRMEKVPAFELLSVGLGTVDDASEKHTRSGGFFYDGERHSQLWRKYRLFVPDFECEILEVFPSRDMFLGGDRWLDEKAWAREPSVKQIYLPTSIPRPQTALTLLLGLAFLLILAFELLMFFTGRALRC